MLVEGNRPYLRPQAKMHRSFSPREKQGRVFAVLEACRIGKTGRQFEFLELFQVGLCLKTFDP